MKALPSIAFNEFKGSAGDVTARVSKGRQVLSSRCQHSHVKTGPQAVSRNRLSSISRSFRKLSDSHMKEWAVLAERMKGISTFGKAAELTAHNAFVRINTNRALAGMPALESAPVHIGLSSLQGIQRKGNGFRLPLCHGSLQESSQGSSGYRCSGSSGTAPRCSSGIRSTDPRFRGPEVQFARNAATHVR